MKKGILTIVLTMTSLISFSNLQANSGFDSSKYQTDKELSIPLKERRYDPQAEIFEDLKTLELSLKRRSPETDSNIIANMNCGHNGNITVKKNVLVINSPVKMPQIQIVDSSFDKVLNTNKYVSVFERRNGTFWQIVNNKASKTGLKSPERTIYEYKNYKEKSGMYYQYDSEKSESVLFVFHNDERKLPQIFISSGIESFLEKTDVIYEVYNNCYEEVVAFNP